MSLPKRVLLSLAVSIGLAVLLRVLGEHFQSELFMYVQFPGFITFASIFGVHGDYDGIAEMSVWAGANILAYWPLVFALSFLIKAKRDG